MGDKTPRSKVQVVERNAFCDDGCGPLETGRMEHPVDVAYNHTIETGHVTFVRKIVERSFWPRE